MFLNFIFKMTHEDFLSFLEQNLLIKPISELKSESFILAVCSNKIKFLAIVESMQGVLTNENVSIREKGIEFLSWILSNLPADVFNSNEVNVVVDFYCDCLKGHHRITPAAIKGLNALIKMKNIMAGAISKIFLHLFQDVNCQNQLQPDRYNIYSLMQFAIENHTETIKQMGAEFALGFISFVEGESDPLCLLLLFNFLPFFLKNVDLGQLAEEMFGVLSCYFPVDFNSVAKDNFIVTRDDLVHGLVSSLSANSIFSEMSLALILEKLDTSLKVAKLDSYKLLQECCKTLKWESLENHLNELWKCLIKDVMPGTDLQICDSALLALQEIIILLSSNELSNFVLHTFLNDILASVKSFMNKADENMFQPAIKVLFATSSGSKLAAQKILCFLKPYYLSGPDKNLLEKKAILSSLLPFIKIFLCPNIIESNDIEVLSSFDALVNLYFSCSVLENYEVRKLGFIGISMFFFNLNEEGKKKLYELISENIKTKDDIRTSKEFCDVWRLTAENNSSKIFHNFNFDEKFFNEIDESFLFRQLWAFSLIADLPNFTCVLISCFIKIIVSSKNYIMGLECLLNTCRLAKVKASKDFYHTVHAEHNILEMLLCWSKSLEPLNLRATLLLSEIIALVVRNEPPLIQEAILHESAKYFFMEFQFSDTVDDISSVNKKGLLKSRQDILLMEAIVGSLHQEVVIPWISDLREKLVNFSLNSSDEFVRLSSSRLLATLVNKLSENSDFIEKIKNSIFEELSGNLDSFKKTNVAFLFTWIVKGVLLSGGSSTEPLISSWFNFLGREDIGWIIAERFHMVMEENDLYLNLESHCNFKVLYRQRLFQHFPKLMKMYDASEGAIKENYLLALVRLLEGVPIHLIRTEISSVVTVLVRCLHSHKFDILASSLNILKALLENKEEIFSEQCQNFIPRFLSLAASGKHMNVRADALKCLYFYGFYPKIILLPNRHKVIRELECCLDDKKRLVRKEAVRARCRWFLVGAPGEDILESDI